MFSAIRLQPWTRRVYVVILHRGRGRTFIRWRIKSDDRMFCTRDIISDIPYTPYALHSMGVDVNNIDLRAIQAIISGKPDTRSTKKKNENGEGGNFEFLSLPSLIQLTAFVSSGDARSISSRGGGVEPSVIIFSIYIGVVTALLFVQSENEGVKGKWLRCCYGMIIEFKPNKRIISDPLLCYLLQIMKNILDSSFMEFVAACQPGGRTDEDVITIQTVPPKNMSTPVEYS